MGNLVATLSRLVGARKNALPHNEVADVMTRSALNNAEDFSDTDYSSEDESDADEMHEKTVQDKVAAGIGVDAPGVTTDDEAGLNRDTSVDRDEEDEPGMNMDTSVDRDEEDDKASESTPSSENSDSEETNSDTDTDTEDENYVEEPPKMTVGRRGRCPHGCRAGGCSGTGNGRVLRSTTAFYRKMNGGT